MKPDQISKHVLIIDDSPDLQVLLKIVLESKGYHIHCSSNGEEALSLLNSSCNLPDMILLDMRMPVMDGYHFITSQRDSKRLRDIPVVVMSADDDNDLTRSQLARGDVLKKPLSMQAVVEAVMRKAPLH